MVMVVVGVVVVVVVGGFIYYNEGRLLFDFFFVIILKWYYLFLSNENWIVSFDLEEGKLLDGGEKIIYKVCVGGVEFVI